MYFVFSWSSGKDLTDHGFYNKRVISMVIVANIILYYFMKFIIQLVFKFKFMLIFFVIFGIWYSFRVHNSWDGWELGIGDSKILNDVGEARIENPNYWELSIRHGLFDLYGILGTCKNQPMKVSPLLYNDRLKERENATRLGYPRVERMPNVYKTVAHYEERMQYIIEGMIDMDDPEVNQQVKDDTEWVLDLTDPDRHLLDVTVKRNNTRVKELKTLRKHLQSKRQVANLPEVPDYNVLIFYIDNISRAHFHRAFPKLTKWLSQFTPEKEANLETVEFFRYHTIGRITSKSTPGMYYGVNKIHVPDDRESIGRYYSKNGFITGYMRDEWDYDSLIIGETDPPTDFYSYDHYGSTVICDPNYDRGSDDFIDLERGHSSQYERWMYSKNIGDMVIDYVEKFWETYEDIPKFMRSSFMPAHELSGESIYHFDDKFLNFFKRFYEKGYFKNTQVLLMSDHGAHDLTIRSPFFPDDSRSIENALALLIHLAPNTTKKENLEFMRRNEQRFLSSHEIYSTLKSLAFGYKEGSPYIEDFSYLHEDLPQGRDWGDVKCHKYCGETIFVNCWLRKDYGRIEKRKETVSYFNPLAIVLEDNPFTHLNKTVKKDKNGKNSKNRKHGKNGKHY